MIEVEKGIPMPPPRSHTKYPWHDMDVGDSFFIKDGNTNKVSTAGRTNKQKTGRSYCVRQVEGGVRVWRTA